jgi:hypothetical protein
MAEKANSTGKGAISSAYSCAPAASAAAAEAGVVPQFDLDQDAQHHRSSIRTRFVCLLIVRAHCCSTD